MIKKTVTILIIICVFSTLIYISAKISMAYIVPSINQKINHEKSYSNANVNTDLFYLCSPGSEQRA